MSWKVIVHCGRVIVIIWAKCTGYGIIWVTSPNKLVEVSDSTVNFLNTYSGNSYWWGIMANCNSCWWCTFIRYLYWKDRAAFSHDTHSYIHIIDSNLLLFQDTPDTLQDQADVPNYYCGAGPCRPKYLQVFANTKFFTMILCVFALTEQALISGEELNHL